MKRVKVIAVVSGKVKGFDYDHTMVDPAGQLRKVYGGSPENQMILIRPDLYVGFRGILGAKASLDAYLEKWLPSNHKGSARVAA